MRVSTWPLWLLLVTVGGCAQQSSSDEEQSSSGEEQWPPEIVVEVERGPEPSGWQAPVALGEMHESGTGCTAPAMALAVATSPSGEVRVAWPHECAETPGTVSVDTIRFRPASGWQEVESLGTGEHHVKRVVLATDTSGRSWLAWTHADGVSSAYTADGQAWSPPETAVYPPFHPYDPLNPRLDPDEAGGAVLYGPGGAWTRIWRPADASWTDIGFPPEPAQLPDGFEPGDYRRKWWRLAAGPAGRLVGTWVICPADVNHDFGCEYYFADYQPPLGWSIGEEAPWGALTLDAAGNGRLIWFCGDRDWYVCEWRMSPGGTDWGAPRRLWPGAGFVAFVAWNAGGDAVVSWGVASDLYAEETFVARTMAQHALQPAERLEYPANQAPALAIGPRGHACAVYPAYVGGYIGDPNLRVTYSVPGKAWQRFPVIAQRQRPDGQPRPAVAIDSIGRVTVVWTDYTGPQPDVREPSHFTVWAARYVP